MSRIRILQQTKKGIITSIINRTSLKNYIPFDKLKNRNVWIKPDFYEEIIKRVTKKVKRKKRLPYKPEEGRTRFMKKKFIRFRFTLWRYKLTDIERIYLLFDRLKKKYNLVKDQGKGFPAQRIGLIVTSQEKEFDTYTRSSTKRKNVREIFDGISTETMANNKYSTIEMFDKLLEDTIKYYLKTGRSPSMLEENSDKTAKYFYVFFSEE